MQSRLVNNSPTATGRLSSRLGTAVVTLATMLLIVNLQRILRPLAFYQELYRTYGFVVPESLRNLLQLALVALALWLLHRQNVAAMARELRLTPFNRQAAVLGILASAPLLLGLLVTRGLAPPALPNLLYLAFLSPLVEEIHARAFTVGQLHWRAGWSLLLVIAVVAFINGFAHADQARNSTEVLALFALTAVGGGVFAWLLVSWGSIWMPLMLHVSMNLWWELFGVAQTALGGWFPLFLQLSALTVAVVLTVNRAPGGPATLRRAPAA